jgi:hypothetical protein
MQFLDELNLIHLTLWSPQEVGKPKPQRRLLLLSLPLPLMVVAFFLD